MKINSNYRNIKQSYLFSEIAQRVNSYSAANPDKKLIRLGIGDVTLPLPKASVEAMKRASCELGEKSTFRGYGPEQGYDFLRNAIAEYYKGFHVTLDPKEVFISDGAKSDLGNILDLFDKDNTVLITDPVYPVYVDTNVMDGRNIVFLNANEQNGFLPMPDESIKADLIYLCSPNNPTGAAYNKQELKAWVDYAIAQDAIILFDSAYEAFILGDELPHSIYEIEGAERVAIEFCSLSKTAGFTGTRCSYTVVPMALEREGMSLNKMWLRRQTTKFNGVSYVVQRGAEAVFTPEGQIQVKENVEYYRENAKMIADCLTELGIWFTGGVHSPYLFLKCPNGMDSWQFFDYLLNEANVVGTPGCGFGTNGEGFFRLTAFSDHEGTKEAVERLRRALK